MSAVAARDSPGTETSVVRGRMVPWYRIAELSIVGVSAVMTAGWIAVDRTPPAWDQARYLTDAYQYVQGFHHSGLGGVVNAFFSADRYYAPGYSAFLFPFLLLLGPSVQSALIANLVLWVVLLLTVGAIARLLFGEKAALVAIAVTATIPELLFFLHQALIDIPAATCACLAVLVMLRTSYFSRTFTSALAGAVVGVGLLTKATVIVFLAGPVAIICARAILRSRDEPAGRQLRVAGNMMLAAVVAIAVAGPWYFTNWDTTVAYLQSSTSGEGARGMGPANPFDPAAFLAFATTIVNAASFALVAGILVLGAVLVTRRLQTRTRGRARRRWAWALLAAWTLVPLAIFAGSHNQDPRQTMFVFPGLAIVFAGLSAMTRPRMLGWSAIAIVLVLGVAQAGVAQLPPLNPIRDAAYLNVVAGPNNLAVFQPAFGVANPTGDDGTPVMRQLEAMAAGRRVRVLVAEEDHVFNPNTLTWLAETRQDRFTFEDPPGLTGDPTELSTYDLVVYMPAPQVQQRNSEPRLVILNRSTATTVFADRLLTIFGRDPQKLTLGDGTVVWVLQR